MVVWEYGMTTTTLPENRALQDNARAEIEQRVEAFRQHQAKMQAERERRWARIMTETRATIQRTIR